MFHLFKQKQYVFSINTGRAGSEYLAKILATGKNVWADHEPRPKMIDDMLELATTKAYTESYKQRVYKVDAIKKIVKQSGCSTYIETNHMFIKTFFDIVVDKLHNVKVIFLKRNIVDTLYSFYQLGYFSDRNEAWKKWMISPYSVTAALPCLLDEEEKDEIGLSLAYLLDIYARGYRFINDYPEIPVVHINLEELNDVEKVKQLFNDLAIPTTDQTLEIIGKRENNRAERKKEIGSKEITKDYLIERCNSYIEKLEDRGIAIREMIII